MSGLYTVDESKLNSLDDQAFQDLRSVLPMAYAQLMSRDNVRVLEKLQPKEEPEPDLENMEELDIDWDKIKI